LRKADTDDQVEAVPGERRHVGDVVRRRLRLDDAALDAQLCLRALEAVVRELVEAVVVQLAEIGDQSDLEGVRGGCP
jgi:hypothetical protein